MERWNGGRLSSWTGSGYHRDRETVRSNVSSSRSGTIASTISSAYTSSGSRCDSQTYWWCEAAEKDRRDRIRSLVLEFLIMLMPSANCSIRRGDMSVVERWLTELGVGWVFSLENGASAGEQLDRNIRIGCWIQALEQNAYALCSRREIFPESDCGSMGLPAICEEEGEPVAPWACRLFVKRKGNSVPDRYHLALFIQETMLKILTFVDVVVAWYSDTMEYSSVDQVMNTKLVHLLVVHNALSEASDKIVTLLDSPTSVEVERIENEMVILLSAYQSKVSEVIRSTMENIRTILMEDGNDSPSPLDPQGSSDIHKFTGSLITYIDFLNNRSCLVNQIMQGHVPCTENIQPLDNMIIEMVSSLQEKLVNISESFPDQALRFLFLLNNSYHIQQIFRSHYYLQEPFMLLADDLTDKIEHSMERYLQVSWTPLQSCLFNPTPLCLGKIYYPLSKFESEFQKTYSTQKQWKVPHPELRRSLREVITDKIIPDYTEYIENCNLTNPTFSPHELKAMLQELFEG